MTEENVKIISDPEVSAFVHKFLKHLAENPNFEKEKKEEDEEVEAWQREPFVQGWNLVFSMPSMEQMEKEKNAKRIRVVTEGATLHFQKDVAAFGQTVCFLVRQHGDLGCKCNLCNLCDIADKYQAKGYTLVKIDEKED